MEVDAVVAADPSGASEAAAARKALGVKLKGFEKDHARTLAEYKPEMALVTLEAVQAPPVIRAARGATGEGLRSPVFFEENGGPKQPLRVPKRHICHISLRQ